MDLPGHSGSHIAEYHEYVYEKLSGAKRGKTGEAARASFLRALDELRKILEDNPRLPYKDGGLYLGL
jgi:hypothetical protein